MKLAFESFTKSWVGIGGGDKPDGGILECGVEDSPNVVMVETGDADPQGFSWVHAG